MSKKECVCVTLILIPILAFFTLQILYTPLSGVFHVSSIHGEAKIVFDDEYGVPYVTGSTNEAVWFGLGFAHASDRLWDLQLKRYLTAGRACEVFSI